MKTQFLHTPNMVAGTVAELVAMNGARFVGLTYRNEQGELANVTVMVGMSTEKAYRRDLALVEAYLKAGNLSPLHIQAATEIRDSLTESLTKGIGNNSRYVHGAHAADTYVEIFPGIRVNQSENEEDRGTVYMFGYRHAKTVIEPGTYKVVNSRPKTIAKNEIKRALHLRSERFRLYKIRMTARAAMNGKTLLQIEDV